MKTCANCKQEIRSDEESIISVISGKEMHTNCKSQCISCGAPLTDEESIANNFKCNACAPTTTKKDINIKSVRRSHIELYRQCPYAFYLEVVKQVPVESNAYALHGIILHNLFEKYSLHPELDKNNLFEEFKDAWKEVPNNHFDFQTDTSLKDKLFDKGMLAIKGYIEYEQTAMPPWKTEERIEFSIGDDMPNVSIAMDRVNKIGEEIHFVDYKCGQVFSGQKLSKDLQVPLYCLASKHAYGKLPKSFTFVFVSEGKTRYYELQGDNTYVCFVRKRKYEVNITEAIREVKTVFAGIKKQEFGIPKNILPFQCKMCYYGKMGICKGRDTQRWLNAGGQNNAT